jgi:proteasome lid subunit RPN8/RPN11
MIIRLTKKQIRLLIEEARKKNPIEACGILYGYINSKDARVRKIIMANNILESPTNFQINPEEFLKALLEAEKNSMQLVGFFHSHPTIPYPSITDVRSMKRWPENIWLIISSIDYSMEAYQNVNDKPRRIYIEINNKC